MQVQINKIEILDNLKENIKTVVRKFTIQT